MNNESNKSLIRLSSNKARTSVIVLFKRVTNPKEVIIPSPRSLWSTIIKSYPFEKDINFLKRIKHSISLNNFNPFDSISFLEKPIGQFILGTRIFHRSVTFSSLETIETRRNPARSSRVTSLEQAATLFAHRVPIVFCAERS